MNGIEWYGKLCDNKITWCIYKVKYNAKNLLQMHSYCVRYPQHLKQMLKRRSSYYSLRGSDILDLPKVTYDYKAWT